MYGYLHRCGCMHTHIEDMEYKHNIAEEISSKTRKQTENNIKMILGRKTMRTKLAQVHVQWHNSVLLQSNTMPEIL